MVAPPQKTLAEIEVELADLQHRVREGRRERERAAERLRRVLEIIGKEGDDDTEIEEGALGSNGAGTVRDFAETGDGVRQSQGETDNEEESEIDGGQERIEDIEGELNA